MSQDLSFDVFRPRLGETFRMQADDQRRIDVELVEATPLGGAKTSPRGQAFSLVFRAPGGELVPQRIYRVEHDELGAHDIFLVPIGPDAGGMRYEAIFT